MTGAPRRRDLILRRKRIAALLAAPRSPGCLSPLDPQPSTGTRTPPAPRLDEEPTP
jgi:hypothetical protein